MFEILAYKKGTENKLRWDADVEGTPFELYIPKWRIPDPAPGKVLIRIFFSKDKIRSNRQFTPSEIKRNPELKNQPIYAEVTRIREHTKTIRFDPIGDNSDWEIGSPYIPKSLLPADENIKKLCLVVEWK